MPPIPTAVAALSMASLVVTLAGCQLPPARLADLDSEQPPRRLENLSPWYEISDDDIELLCDYGVVDTRADRKLAHLEIVERALCMIDDAEDFVLLSFFLFDNLYADGDDGPDVVGALADALARKKADRPDLPVVLILDRMHSGWGNRVSPTVELLARRGVTVVYSDVLDTRAAAEVGLFEAVNELGRAVDPVTGGALGAICDAVGAVPIPGPRFDGEPVTLGTIGNLFLLKANHRKVIVTASRGEYEAMVTSWNPHNPSALHANHALVVRGRPARYTYAVLREDVARSIELGGEHLLDPRLAAADAAATLARLPEPCGADLVADARDATPAGRAEPAPGPRVAVATESAIEAMLLDMLERVDADDEVRIQMFYLSRPPVIEAILDAARRTRHPVRLLLDRNRSGIEYPKTGTPNVPVARYMMERAERESLDVEIRWYHAIDDQNHAKAMSITDAEGGTSALTVGSANWTRKNLGGINLEMNLFVEAAPRLNRRFNELFDRMWWNLDDGMTYSVAYDEVADADGPWTIEWALVLWLPPPFDDEPILLERSVVHW